MSEINFRQDKQDSIKAVVDPKQLADKVQQLKNLEDEIYLKLAQIRRYCS